MFIEHNEYEIAKTILDVEHYFASAICLHFEEQGTPHLIRRRNHSHYSNLMKELSEEDPVLYRNFLRLPKVFSVVLWSGYGHVFRRKLPGGGSPWILVGYACCNHPQVPGHGQQLQEPRIHVLCGCEM